MIKQTGKIHFGRKLNLTLLYKWSKTSMWIS